MPGGEPIPPNHGAIIIDPNGIHHPIISGRFFSAVNVGCQWNVVIPYQIDPFSFGEFGKWFLVVGNRNGGAPWESCPPLKMTTGSANRKQTSLSGIDMASYRLSVPSFQLMTYTPPAPPVPALYVPLYTNMDSWDIIQAVGTLFGVTIGLNAGCPRFNVETFPTGTDSKAQSKPKAVSYSNPLSIPYTYTMGVNGNEFTKSANTAGNLLADLIHKMGCFFRVNNDTIEIIPNDLSLGIGFQKTPVNPLVVNLTTYQLNDKRKVSSIILQKPALDGGLGGAYTYDWQIIYPVGAVSDLDTVTISSPLWTNVSVANAVAPLIFKSYNKDRGQSLLCDLDPNTTFGLPGFDIPADPLTYAFFMESIEMQIGVQNSMMVTGPIANWTLPPADPPI